VQWELSEHERPLEREARTELRPRGLEISEEELKCMEELRALLGQSPRAVKRFVNVYRLIKASATGRTIDFVSACPDADYKIVLFLLAVVTGLTSISAALFQEVTRGEEKTLGGLVDKFVQQVAAKSAQNTDTGALTAGEAGQLNTLLGTSEGAGWKELATARLTEWVRQVARFSYRIELS
jgi:hypothetical protein